MAALFVDEDEAYKCSKHPSKRRRTGICPTCLRERLLALCPECGNLRPCFCCATSSSSSSSSSSSLSRFAVGIAGEPSLNRSRSMAIPFLRSRSRFSAGDCTDESPALHRSSSTRSFWSMFKASGRSRGGDDVAAAPAKSKGKGWFFPSPIKVFRQAKAAKVNQERSPLYRG